MSKFVKAKVDELLARESHHWQEQKNHEIHAAMEVHLYGAEKVTTSKRRQFEVLLNRARQAASIWSDADWQRVIERLESTIYQVTPAKRKLFDKLLEHHERHLFQIVGTKATVRRRTFTKELPNMKTASEEVAYGAANMTAHKRVQFQVCLSDAEIEATTGSIADTHRVVNQFEREICGITSTDQRQFSKKFSIHLVEVEAWWQANGVQQLWKTIEQRAIHFGYPTMHVVSHISE
jgi:hypothetical protein